MKTKNIVKGFGDKFSVKSVGKILFFCMVIFGVIISMSSIVMAEYIDQPDSWNSTINAFDGNHIYDFELANLIENYIGDNCSDMIFIFGTCFGGGMIDDIVAMKNKSKLIACSASRHNERSWGGCGPNSQDDYKKAFKDAIDKNPDRTVSDLCDEAEKNDESGPNQNVWCLVNGECIKPAAGCAGIPPCEHPQKKLDGAGAANIKIGNKSTATSYHAILFVGVDAPRHKNDLKRMYDNLKAKYGFTDDNIHVLALNGPGSVPGVTVDGNGTSDALENELKNISPEMNESEQFLFWADGHGNRERVNSTVTEVPHYTNTTYTITLGDMIDEWYEGHVGIFAESVTAGDGTKVYFNGNLLGSLSNKTTKTIFSFDKNLFLESKNEIIIENICNPETICITKVTTGGSSSGDKAPEVKVEVNAPELVKAGETFEASIDVDSIVDFNSGQFDLSFDSRVVKVMGVAGGSIDGAPIPVFMWDFIDSNTVRVVSMPMGVGVSGSGYLAKVEFKVVGKGGDKSKLDISNGMLVNTEAKEIDADWYGDEVTVLGTVVSVGTPEYVTESFNAIIRIDDVTDFNSGQFDLSFNSSVVKVTNVADGCLDGETIPVNIWDYIDEDTIRVIFDVPGIGGVSGSGNLAMISFEVVGKSGDRSVLDISSGMLVNAEAEAIPADWFCGEVIIGPKQVNLTAKQPRNVVAEDDDCTIEGTATGVDDVDIVLIGPEGYYPIYDPLLDVLNGLEITSTPVTDCEFSEYITMGEGVDTGRWIAMVFSPGRDGTYGDLSVGAGNLAAGFDIEVFVVVETQDQIVEILKDHTVNVAGSDDLLESFTFKVESPFVKLNPIESVAVGEPLVVTGTSNRKDGYPIVITVKGPVELCPQTVKLENGTFTATFDTTGAIEGNYTVKADDGDGHTDDVTVEIFNRSYSLSGQHLKAVFDPADFDSIKITVKETHTPCQPDVWEDNAFVSDLTQGILFLSYIDVYGETVEVERLVYIDNLKNELLYEGLTVTMLRTIFDSLPSPLGEENVTLLMDFSYPIGIEMCPLLQLQSNETKYVTDKNKEVTTFDDGKPNEDDLTQEKADEILERLGLKDKVTQTAPPTDSYDCHGWTFTDGEKWINNDQVQNILDDNRYSKRPPPPIQVGDIVVYKKNGGITHTGIVKEVDENGNVIKVESKWGRLGRYEHAPSDVPTFYYGTPEYYHTNRAGGHKLETK